MGSYEEDLMYDSAYRDGYGEGVHNERNRIIRRFHTHEANRTIPEFLEYHYTAQEIEATIREAQDD